MAAKVQKVIFLSRENKASNKDKFNLEKIFQTPELGKKFRKKYREKCEKLMKIVLKKVVFQLISG